MRTTSTRGRTTPTLQCRSQHLTTKSNECGAGRFALDKVPLDRAKAYLESPSEWVPISKGPILSQHYEYHRQFPEFTVHDAEADDWTARNEEWTRGEIRRDNNHAWYKEVYYHQTLLATVRGVTFDDGKKEMVAPKWEPRGTGRFYYYEQDTIEYAMQTFPMELEERFRPFGESPFARHGGRRSPKQSQSPLARWLHENSSAACRRAGKIFGTSTKTGAGNVIRRTRAVSTVSPQPN